MADDKKNGVAAAHGRVWTERQHQIAKGYTPEHDYREYKDNELSRVAWCIVRQSNTIWPWSWNLDIMQKLFQKPKEERLIIAAALQLAELEAFMWGLENA